MLACDGPQYSAQCPFHDAAPSVESGVNQRKFVWFAIRSRLPDSAGIQNECSTSAVFSAKFTVRPAGRYSSFAVVMLYSG